MDGGEKGKKGTGKGKGRGVTKAGRPATSAQIWLYFWGSHQRFFRHLCVAAKVPGVVRLAKTSLRDGKAVVIGLQATGEARTMDALNRRSDDDDDMDDFVSSPEVHNK